MLPAFSQWGGGTFQYSLEVRECSLILQPQGTHSMLSSLETLQPSLKGRSISENPSMLSSVARRLVRYHYYSRHGTETHGVVEQKVM